MPVTGAERNKKYRSRIKEDAEVSAVYKEKDKERKRANRKRAISPTKAATEKMKCRERVRLCRLKKKLAAKSMPASSNDVPAEFAYKSPQALGKAVNKVSNLLPNSPRKKRAVISKLAKSSGLSCSNKTQQGNKTQGNRHIPTSTVNKAQEFYYNDSISRQAPGRRDFVVVRENGKKTKLQKRHLIWSLKETFGLFNKENPEIKIGLSKFCSLRPANVLLQSNMPRQVCLCQYHDNMKMLCESLSKEMSSFPLYSMSFPDNLVCNSSNEDCMLGKCNKCPKWIEHIKKDAPLDEDIQWSQWERISQPYESKGGKLKHAMKMVKVLKEGTVEEALCSLEEKIPFFLEHVFIKRKQAAFFEGRISQLKPDEAVVQVDFAENYTCQYQDEIQSAHWSQEQITLFTVAIWVKDSANKATCNSHVIVSDDHRHDKQSIAVFMDTVVNTFIRKCYPQIKVVDVFSDGPSSQFKNKYMVNFYSTLQRNGLQIKWHFFATSHGKGVVDGLGGTVKRVVWTAVSTRKVPNVLSAEAFAKIAMQFCKSISITLCLKKDIILSSTTLALDQCFKKAKPIPGIKKIHCIEASLKGQIQCRLYSSQPLTNKVELSSDSEDLPSDFSVSDTESSECSSYSNDRDDIDNACSDDVLNASLHTDAPPSTTSSPTGIDIHIELGLPQNIKALLNEQYNEFEIHPCNTVLAKLVVNGGVEFEGDSIFINSNDLKELEGNAISDEEKWISNFVIDSYLELIKAEGNQKSIGVEFFQWEEFEKGVGKKPIEDLLQGKGNLLQQDAVLFPCNNGQSKHWFLGVVLPKERCIIVLDSLPGESVKSCASSRVAKMMSFLQMTDQSIDISQWSFYANKPDEIPQQENGFDCGIFTCLYARCLATRCSMVTQQDIPAYRQLMIQELHQNKLSPIPPQPIQPGEYYAVAYEKQYYFGRVLSTTTNYVEFKFLHGVGASTIHWPRRDDIEQVPVSTIFYGPVTVPTFISGPFIVPEQQAVEKVYKAIAKQKRHKL